MLTKSLRLAITTNFTHVLKDSFCTASAQKWDLLSAVCVERKSVVTPRPNDLEAMFQKLLHEVEFERSLKSDHEMRHEKELIQLESLKKGDVDLDVDVTLKNTAQDFADACLEELSKFEAASIVTEDDKSNNQKSTNRKLDKHLVLLVKQKIGNKSYFVLPQGARGDGETLRQTADRVLKEICGENLKAQIYSNAPVGFYKYRYPKSVQVSSNAVGAKLFFYFARYQSGSVNTEDFKWLDRQEMEKVLPPEYRTSVAQFLLDE